MSSTTSNNIPSPLAIKRIGGDFKKFDKDNEFCDAISLMDINQSNDISELLEIYFLMYGAKGTPYEGGHYVGKITHDPDYPRKAPGWMVLTPSGRFEPNKRICLNGISDFHQESWAQGTSLFAMLTSFYSIWHTQEMTDNKKAMKEDMYAIASLDNVSNEVKIKYAKASVEYNQKHFSKIYSSFSKVKRNFKPYEITDIVPIKKVAMKEESKEDIFFKEQMIELEKENKKLKEEHQSFHLMLSEFYRGKKKFTNYCEIYNEKKKLEDYEKENSLIRKENETIQKELAKCI